MCVYTSIYVPVYVYTYACNTFMHISQKKSSAAAKLSSQMNCYSFLTFTDSRDAKVKIAGRDVIFIIFWQAILESIYLGSPATGAC